MRKSLLFISHRVPFPPHNGAAIRTLNILRQLAEEFDIHAICFERPDKALAGQSMASRVNALSQYASVEVFPIPQLQSRTRLAADHARSALTGRPYTWYIHDVPEALAAIAASLERLRPAVIHVDSLDLVRALPLLPLAQTVVTHHNVESDLLRLRATQALGLRRTYLNLQAASLARAESHWAPRVALNIAVSDADAKRLRVLAPAARVEVIANGVDVDEFTPSNVEPDGSIVFVGGTSWYPNLDGLRWFSADILPRLRSLGVSAPVRWIGRATEAEKHEFGHDGLELTGYVDDIRPLVSQASCFIAPLRVGGGTRLKLLDAWAMGMAVVTTTIGAEGLGAKSHENALIADNADAFAAAIAELLRDAPLRRRIGVAARQRAEQVFAWPKLGAKMSRLYNSL